MSSLVSNFPPKIETSAAVEHQLVAKEIADISADISLLLLPNEYKDQAMDWLRQKELPLEDGTHIIITRSNMTKWGFTSIKRIIPGQSGASTISEWRWSHVYPHNRDRQHAIHAVVDAEQEKLLHTKHRGFTQEESSLIVAFVRRFQSGDVSPDSGMFGRFIDFDGALLDEPDQETIDG